MTDRLATSFRASKPFARFAAAAALAVTSVVALAALTPGAAWADDPAPVKIGMITTLSTAGGYLGEDVRDGFLLAVKMNDGKLGGVPVDVLVEDDERKPERGAQIAEKFIKADKVDVLTGIIFSNVAMAVVPKVVRDGMIYLSPNAGPSQLAGKGCHENYFNVAWQNDNQHEAIAMAADKAGVKSLVLMAPNYPAGKDAISGYKRYFTGEVKAEIYTQLGQTDYAAEIAAIRDAKPEGVMYFLPGGMGINFLKQFHQAGLTESTQVFGPGFSFDERLLGAVGEAALGAKNASQYSYDLDNPANTAFVEAFRAAYDRPVTMYASQGYDTAMLLGSALKATGGKVGEDLEAFRAALKKADFPATRGAFAFGSNNHPVQTYYLREVVSDGNGGFTNANRGAIVENHGDAYAADCPMK